VRYFFAIPKIKTLSFFVWHFATRAEARVFKKRHGKDHADAHMSSPYKIVVPKTFAACKLSPSILLLNNERLTDPKRLYSTPVLNDAGYVDHWCNWLITIRKVKNHVPARYVIMRKCHSTCNTDAKQWGCGGGRTNGKMGPGAAGK